VITYFVHRDGKTTRTDALDRAWLDPAANVTIWADVEKPTADDGKILREVFKLHDLAVEDALQPLQHPKIEPYDTFLYVVLHGIDFKREEHAFVTQDVDFFLGRTFLVTVHESGTRSITELAEICGKNEFVLREGTVGVFHRIVDRMVDHYRPEVDELEQWLDEIEQEVLAAPGGDLTSQILEVKRDISSMRRVVVPQRDIVGRLARREFDVINQEMAYRFRDIYDHLVRLADESFIFQDRVTGILDAHLASVSNRLAFVSKVLAAVAVIFGPLTVITGLFGMNVTLPQFPGGEHAQFWWITGTMTVITGIIYAMFRRKDWL